MEGAWTRLTTAAAAAAAAAASAPALPQPPLPYPSFLLDQASLAHLTSLATSPSPTSSSTSSSAFCSGPPRVTPDFCRGFGVMESLVGYPQQVPGYLGFNSPLPPGFVGPPMLDRVHPQIPAALLTSSSSTSSTNTSISCLPTLTRMSPPVASSSSSSPHPHPPPPPPPLQCFSSLSNSSASTKSTTATTPSGVPPAAPSAPEKAAVGEPQERVPDFHSNKSDPPEEAATEGPVGVRGPSPAEGETGHEGAGIETNEIERREVPLSSPPHTSSPSPSLQLPPSPSLLSSFTPDPPSSNSPPPSSPPLPLPLSALPQSSEQHESSPSPSPETTTMSETKSLLQAPVSQTNPLQDNLPSTSPGEKGRPLRKPPPLQQSLQPPRPLKCINCSFTTMEDMETLLDHVDSHYPVRTFLCVHCYSSFPGPKQLQHHKTSGQCLYMV